PTPVRYPLSLHDALPICTDHDKVASGIGAGDIFSNSLLEPRLHDVARRKGNDSATGKGVAGDVAVRRLCHAELAQVARERRLREDRKSTRLNSSHGSISY